MTSKCIGWCGGRTTWDGMLLCVLCNDYGAWLDDNELGFNDPPPPIPTTDY